MPISSSKNTKFYIAAIIFNMENIINNYIKQMKKLILYLGEKNVIISIVENGDSKDKTNEYLRDFKNYLNRKKIINKIILEHVIDDPRKKKKPFRKYGPLKNPIFGIIKKQML